jgi:hypothetical protein
MQVNEIDEARIDLRMGLRKLDGDIQYIRPKQCHEKLPYL